MDAAIELVRTRFGGKAWSGAAALRLADGTILTSTAPDVAVGVPDLDDPRRWRSLLLRDVQPHWFARVFPEDGIWPIGT